MDRTYLYVPPEERAAVRSAGAHWDDRLKCWYIRPADDRARFARWLGTDRDPELSIISDRAHVAAATVPCRGCRQLIEVICIYCESGVDVDEPLNRFTVSTIWSMDTALAYQLQPWPHFKKGRGALHPGYFANHCPQCGAAQEDMYLHDEPQNPFFSVPHAPPGMLRLTPLVGQIQLNGCCRFSI